MSDSGATFIGYSAALTWNALHLSYASYLADDGQHPPWTKMHLRHERPPIHRPSLTAWASNGLACAGTWSSPPASALAPLTLYADAGGAVRWHCLQPLARTSIYCPGLTPIHGLGYVELLELTLPPWDVPLHELHWGRFLAPEVALVWIAWRGPHPLTLVLLNGAPIDQASIHERGLGWADGALALSDTTVLRQGPLLQTVLAAIPGVSACVPASIRHTYERKWRSRGLLTSRTGIQRGWVIHEVVSFLPSGPTSQLV
jgi:hypothetical protein